MALLGILAVNVLYLVSATDNPLYQGKFRLRNRYQTYGQHSFIYDFFVAASRKGIRTNLLVEGLKVFPLARPLQPHCSIAEFADTPDRWDTDIVLVDTIPDDLLKLVPSELPTFCIVHNAGANYSDVFLERCNRFICMTETALSYQAKRIESSKLVLIHQGVDTERFKPRHPDATVPCPRPRVLVYSRLDKGKEDTLLRVIEELISEDMELTVLVDGDAFWTISDRFGAELTLVNHIPCHSVHHFLGNFDLVISSGRGVMEALASGLPALCAGLGYGGPVLPENIRQLLRRNLTGFNAGCNISDITKDVRMAMTLDRRVFRRMAEDHCSVDRFIDQLFTTAQLHR